MNLKDLLDQRREELARADAAKQDILTQLNRVERTIIALQASIATIEQIMKGQEDGTETKP